MTQPSEPLAVSFAAIDAANAPDPNAELVKGQGMSRRRSWTDSA